MSHFANLFMLFLAAFTACDLVYSQEQLVDRNELSGGWIVTSVISDNVVSPAIGKELYFEDEFIAITEQKLLSNGKEITQTNVHLLSWERSRDSDSYRKGKLFTNPDPETGLKKFSKQTISGFVCCWMKGNAGIVVFSENEVELEIADMQALSEQTSAFKIYSLYRNSGHVKKRKEFIKDFLDMIEPSGALKGQVKELHGGWVKELEDYPEIKGE